MDWLFDPVFIDFLGNSKSPFVQCPQSNRFLFFSVFLHPYIMSPKRLVDGVRKMAIFADVQYYLCWQGWVGQKFQKMCWRNIGMVPYSSFYKIQLLVQVKQNNFSYRCSSTKHISNLFAVSPFLLYDPTFKFK